MLKSTQRTALLCMGFLLCLVSEISAQHSMQQILGKLTSHTTRIPVEKVYLQTDKDSYTKGETIWFKTYLLNGTTHIASAMSSVIYVELLDANENIVAQQKLVMESVGAAGDITLSDKMEVGTYTLRAYTKYMLNDKEPILFQKEISISASQPESNGKGATELRNNKRKDKSSKADSEIIKQTKPIVQFFPEGGELVTGIECVLATKITDAEGNGLALKGKILDQDGHLVSLFDSYEFGLGWSSLKPEPNTDYYLHIPIDGTMVKYPVPQPVEKGYALRVMNRGSHIMITASTTITNGLQNAMLVGHTRGDVIFKQVLKGNNENSTTIKLLTSKLQDGIAHFTLFTPNKEPVCERLTFIENPENNLDLFIETNKSNYGLREKMSVDLAVVDTDAKPLEGDFSMSVFAKSEMQEGTENIKSWLLLNSDLGSTISNPIFFFKEEINGREYLLDLLMLTHGWRRFTWKSILKDSVRKEIAFPPEKGIMITGTTTAFNNKYKPKKTLATLNIVANELIQEKRVTDTLGRFSFGPFVFKDSITAVLNANSWPLSKKRKDRFSIYLDSYFPEVKVKNNEEIDGGSTKKVTNTVTKSYPSVVRQKAVPDFEYDPDVTYLNEVVVKDRKINKQALLDKKLNARALHGYPSARLMPDSIPSLGKGTVNAFSALRFVAGARVIGTFPNERVVIRGESPSLYLLDGVPVSAGQIQSVQISDILFIDVLKGADAAFYGGRGNGPVIAVYMKTGEDIAQKTTPYFEYDPDVTYLNEVVVKDKKLSKQAVLDEKLNARTIYGYPSTRLMPDSIPGLGNGVVNAFNVLRRDPSVRVLGTFPNQQAFIRPIFGEAGGAPPLYLLDGTPVSAGQIQSIRVTDILFIDILKGADASIYGGRAAGGVVAVYMKTGEFTEEKPKENSNYINATIPGFYKAREFYRPNYAIEKPEHKKLDYRRTLHWEPNIELKDDSVANLNFYTGDIESEYVIRIEGITTDGRPVSKLYNFNVVDPN